MSNRCTEEKTRLERAAIKAGLARYREWLKKHGNPDRSRFGGTTKSWDMLLAFKALHEKRSD